MYNIQHGVNVRFTISLQKEYAKDCGHYINKLGETRDRSGTAGHLTTGYDERILNVLFHLC